MTVLKVFKETTLPGTLQANSIYYVTSANVDYVEVYVTSSSGVARRVPKIEDINSAISTALLGINSLAIYATIADRDTNALNNNHKYVYVTDATGDATVTSGGATYLYNSTTTTWIKVSEAESMDVILSWANIQNKPTSSVVDIDNAVTLRHSHTNSTVLNALAQDVEGNLTYNGNPVPTAYITVNW